jgi:hypothetical protein
MSTCRAGRRANLTQVAAGNRAGCWVCAIFTLLSLLSSPTMARAQEAASAPVTQAPEAADPKDSRIASSVAQDVSAVVVLVDTKETGTATLGQLTDYVAMAGLARIDLHADLASSSTILRLFEPSDSDGAPSGLTDWIRPS